MGAGHARLQSAMQHEARYLAPLAARITAEEIIATHDIIARMRALLEGRPVPEIKLLPAPRVRIAVPRRPATRVALVQEVPPPPATPEVEDNSLPFNLL